MRNIIIIGSLLITSVLFAQEKQLTKTQKDSIESLNEVIITTDAIIGSKFKAKNKAGSTYFISPKELKTFNYDDVSRVLRTVPGINIQEEDGFGLRPNIGMRGTSPDRSGNITLMEDGVLIAPAPYAAPAAYYFPTVNRMQSFEIVKGGSQIQYGPYTTGGAINMVSTQIPNRFTARVVASIGSFNTKKTYVNLGDERENFGYVLEYNNRNSDGFKKIDNSTKNTGFQGNDYVAKFRINTDLDAKVFQSLTAKVQFSEDFANETYLGLTEDDFNNSPYRRYAGSNEDYIDTEHKQIMFTHFIQPSKNFNITTKAYKNDFARNWYKLDALKVGTTKVGINSILIDPTRYNAEYLALTGAANTADNALLVKANNRMYESKGIQSVANYNFATGTLKHDLDFGFRYHEDYEDRFQWVDGYAIQNGVMNRTSNGTPGTDANRITNAEAIAAHVLYTITYDKFTFSPGIRYENINLESINYGSNDIIRTGTNIVNANNRSDVWIPGMGILYKINEDYNVFTSVHKGFSPPGAKVGEDAENSINSELGFRFQKNAFYGELIGYYNDFSNLQGSDNMSGGGTGTGDLFNAGAAIVKGIEFLATYEILNNSEKGYKLPLSFSYTLTDTKLNSDFNSPIWGNVTRGDEIPYIAKNQFALTAAFETEKFNLAISGKYVDAFRTLAGTGTIPSQNKVNSNFIVDFSARYHLSQKVSLMSNIINLMNEKYAVSRVPAGLRPGMPFSINFGIMAQL
ncbi:TonB-dependent receptor family protein [Flavobacterium sp. RSP15]|uniref:TonB-dependent receptor family protein n=1 Tax=Flavobacterium sp. RSP15 TaxID=2497485 RepID=UPI000F82D383|nr:TonB-dependent receptor [Flavobacterium sp. RSP15]RTY88362.1 TonB-dependent receptor [Flavobacterium sp. RSP15]